jgi:hypothetical protein
MTIVLVGTPPTEVEQYLERRRQLGLDGKDEVWDGVYHVVPHAGMRHSRVQRQVENILDLPAQRRGLYVTGDFNLGNAHSFRVPDFGVHQVETVELYVPHAPLVGEVLSPDDETWKKFDFYAELRIPEIMVVDPVNEKVMAFTLDLPSLRYDEIDVSKILGISTEKVARSIQWP